MKLFKKEKKKDSRTPGTKPFAYDFNLTSPFEYVIEFDENNVKAEIFKVIDGTGVDAYNTPICEFYVRNAAEKAKMNLDVQRSYHKEQCGVIARQDQIEKNLLLEMATALRNCMERGEGNDDRNDKY